MGRKTYKRGRKAVSMLLAVAFVFSALVFPLSGIKGETTEAVVTEQQEETSIVQETQSPAVTSGPIMGPMAVVSVGGNFLGGVDSTQLVPNSIYPASFLMNLEQYKTYTLEVTYPDAYTVTSTTTVGGAITNVQTSGNTIIYTIDTTDSTIVGANVNVKVNGSKIFNGMSGSYTDIQAVVKESGTQVASNTLTSTVVINPNGNLSANVSPAGLYENTSTKVSVDLSASGNYLTLFTTAGFTIKNVTATVDLNNLWIQLPGETTPTRIADRADKATILSKITVAQDTTSSVGYSYSSSTHMITLTGNMTGYSASLPFLMTLDFPEGTIIKSAETSSGNSAINIVGYQNGFTSEAGAKVELKGNLSQTIQDPIVANDVMLSGYGAQDIYLYPNTDGEWLLKMSMTNGNTDLDNLKISLDVPAGFTITGVQMPEISTDSNYEAPVTINGETVKAGGVIGRTIHTFATPIVGPKTIDIVISKVPAGATIVDGGYDYGIDFIGRVNTANVPSATLANNEYGTFKISATSYNNGTAYVQNPNKDTYTVKFDPDGKYPLDLYVSGPKLIKDDGTGHPDSTSNTPVTTSVPGDYVHVLGSMTGSPYPYNSSHMVDIQPQFIYDLPEELKCNFTGELSASQFADYVYAKDSAGNVVTPSRVYRVEDASGNPVVGSNGGEIVIVEFDQDFAYPTSISSYLKTQVDPGVTKTTTVDMVANNLVGYSSHWNKLLNIRSLGFVGYNAPYTYLIKSGQADIGNFPVPSGDTVMFATSTASLNITVDSSAGMEVAVDTNSSDPDNYLTYSPSTPDVIPEMNAGGEGTFRITLTNKLEYPMTDATGYFVLPAGNGWRTIATDGLTVTDQNNIAATNVKVYYSTVEDIDPDSWITDDSSGNWTDIFPGAENVTAIKFVIADLQPNSTYQATMPFKVPSVSESGATYGEKALGRTMFNFGIVQGIPITNNNAKTAGIKLIQSEVPVVTPTYKLSDAQVYEYKSNETLPNWWIAGVTDDITQGLKLAQVDTTFTPQQNQVTLPFTGTQTITDFTDAAILAAVDGSHVGGNTSTINDSTFIDLISKNYKGVYTITYTSTKDADQQATVVTRTITIQDTIPADLEDQTLEFTAGAKIPDSYTDWMDYFRSVINVTDNQDDVDLSQITLTPLSGNFDINVPGTYTFTIGYTDPADNVSVEKTLTVIVTSAPKGEEPGNSNPTTGSKTINTASQSKNVWLPKTGNMGVLFLAGAAIIMGSVLVIHKRKNNN